MTSSIFTGGVCLPSSAHWGVAGSELEPLCGAWDAGCCHSQSCAVALLSALGHFHCLRNEVHTLQQAHILCLSSALNSCWSSLHPDPSILDIPRGMIGCVAYLVSWFPSPNALYSMFSCITVYLSTSLLFHGQIIFHCVVMPHLSIHWLVDIYCFHLLTIMNDVTMNISYKFVWGAMTSFLF